MTQKSIELQVKSIIANITQKCSCSISLSTNFAHYGLLGEKYNTLKNKIQIMYPLLESNIIEKTYINGQELVNDIFNIYSKK